MKKITLSADESLIEAARDRAREERTRLNEQFRQWLATYARAPHRARDYDRVVGELRGNLKVGAKLTRESMNEH